MSKRITIDLTDAENREVVRAFRSLRKQVADQRRTKRGGHPIDAPDDPTAARWFLAAALVAGARKLDEEGPG